MSETMYYVLSALLSLGVLLGIRCMSKVETAANGNRLSALCMLAAVILVLAREGIFDDTYVWIGLAGGLALGVVLARAVRMITMPQMVGLLNGLGGAASAIAAWLTLTGSGALNVFEVTTGELALCVGALTFTGSIVAAGKLQRLLPQKPIRWPGHSMFTALSAAVMVGSLVLAVALPAHQLLFTWLTLLGGLTFGLLFALPVGGADMPITISLLNSTSGVAAAIAGMAIGDVLLVSVGGIVGASGLLLTQIMCRAMNRKLSAILLGKGADKTIPTPVETSEVAPSDPKKTEDDMPPPVPKDAAQWLSDAQDIVIIPGYGMALSQAQEAVKQLYDQLSGQGKRVRFAIHPVAGRMPGHMNVLLAEVDIPYDMLFEMDDINPTMESVDLAIVIGANDVINPAANTAEGTPIYGMPVLEVEKARRVIIMNYDDKPGYAGVPNPLYQERPNVLLLFGDAKRSLTKLLP
ncbi:MAG: NAD(P)(+) transhydrogenase (Re/Si-specific) subunit beta [Clostridiales bacterium]|nr:NAD(P)(+) transhydrogenase (Re/Si-specific) subunit beta [Clostridiales bacterium]